MKKPLLCVLLLFLASRITACVCDTKPALNSKADLTEYSFIALVRILKIDSVSSDTYLNRSVHKANFEILETFKGEKETSVLVDGGHASLKGIRTSCDLGESVDEVWVIFAYIDATSKKLFTHSCTRTFRYKKIDGYRYKGYGDEQTSLEKLQSIFVTKQLAKKPDEKHVVYYNNGQLELEENITNQVLEGKRSLWYPNGQIESIQYYRDGKRDGSCYWYTEQGQLITQAKFEKGHPIDTTIHWYTIDTARFHLKLYARLHRITMDSVIILFSRAQVWSKQVYDKMGDLLYSIGFERSGTISNESMYDPIFNKVTLRYYHPNGRLQSEQYQINNKDFGIYRQWDDQGKQVKYWEYDAEGKQIKSTIQLND
jgi:antitoxin component YwqK of YwqJK toxin-antitoxin module